MSEKNTTFIKLKILSNFLEESQKCRQQLLDELVDNATDPVIKKRRFRMLSNLATYEASIIKKIYESDLENAVDVFQAWELISELDLLLDRSA